MAKTILIVDDDPAQRRLLQAAVERNGFHTRTADNGQQAVDAVDTHHDIDIVLLDLVMPGMSGSELARKAAALRPSLRIVLMTGFDSDDYSGNTASMFSMLRKPFTTGQLIRAIEEAPVQPCRKRDGQGSGSRAEP